MVSFNEARSVSFGGPVVVTGSSGFVGRHVVAKFQRKGIPVREFDIATGQDILNEHDLLEALDGARLCVHLAAIADLYQSDERPDTNFTLNVIGTNTVAKACDRLGVPIAYGSTCCAYGNHVEAGHYSALQPTERYAASKAAGEFVVRQYPNQWTILRLPTIYGPGMRESLFVFRVIDSIANNEPVTLHGPGDQARQYGFVADVAENIVRLGSSPGVWSLNGSTPISNVRVVSDVCRLLGRGARVQFGPERPGQIYRQNISSDLENETPWSVGISKTVDWYREAYGFDRRSGNSPAEFVAAS